ncbi:MAG TPA: lipoprotein insertase outer membrane protein LolB [Caldimonas sp.]|jgi:outer membrane lipoprotein LolB|nr:lipoprotein insertase outer membrane protein LolB [Caldimonas sp.]HEV7574461.1 lipoprotein insertase outer membrane protein LolB [Caldimonas sp.]
MPRPTFAPPWRFAVAVFVALVAACTTVPTAPLESSADELSGRLALRVEPVGNEAARAVSAAFDLRGDSNAGTLGLSTPLGSMLAQARWSPAEVVLTTPRETRRFASLDELTREALGESVPIAAWFDWLRGRPWPGAPSEPVAPGAAGFRQLGWRVDLGQLGDGTIVATRETPAPPVTARIRLDRP